MNFFSILLLLLMISCTKEEFNNQYNLPGSSETATSQEVQEVLPEVVSTNNEGYLTVSYGNMVSLLIEGIKEQHKEIEELKAAVQQLINNS